MAIRITEAGVALTVGIIIVTALIIGGLFYAKNTGEQARREEAIKIAEQNLNEQSKNSGVALNDGDVDKDTSESTPSSDESADTSTSNQAAAELPRTGPADQLVSIVVLTLVTFSIASYITSRSSISSLSI